MHRCASRICFHIFCHFCLWCLETDAFYHLCETPWGISPFISSWWLLSCRCVVASAFTFIAFTRCLCFLVAVHKSHVIFSFCRECTSDKPILNISQAIPLEKRGEKCYRLHFKQSTRHKFIMHCKIGVEYCICNAWAIHQTAKIAIISYSGKRRGYVFGLIITKCSMGNGINQFPIGIE